MDNFDIGRVLSRTFRLVVEGLTSAGALLLLAQAIGAVVQFLATRQIYIDMQAAQNGGDVMAGLMIFRSGGYWLALVVTFVLGAISYAGSIYGYVRIGNGEQVTLVDCVGVGLSRVLPTIGLMILWGLAVALGWVLLIVPGIILICMWSVVLPVLICEDSGVFATFGRSRALTKGSRFKIFLDLLIVLILVYAVLFGLMGIMLGTGLGGMTMGTHTDPLLALMMIPITWIFAMIVTANLASLYIETLQVKEQGGTRQVSEVFG